MYYKSYGSKAKELKFKDCFDCDKCALAYMLYRRLWGWDCKSTSMPCVVERNAKLKDIWTKECGTSCDTMNTPATTFNEYLKKT